MDAQKTWNKILSLVKEQIPPHNFRAWFGTTSLKDLTPQEIVIATPSAFISEQLNLRYLPILEEIIKEVTGNALKIHFMVDGQKAVKKRVEDVGEDIFQVASGPNQPSYLNPKFTLENFVVGPSNNVAFAAAQAVVQNPGTSYNPVLIYGGTGVGKTHLMLGIGNAILKKNPAAKVIYCSSEKFTNDYIQAIQNHKMIDHRNRYRSAQILLIDDVQFFSGREGTQEEFFHTFNELQSKNSQMILTSDRPPQEIAKLEDRLRSRFAGGLMVDIQAPDFDTRVAILRAKCIEWGNTIPEDSLKLIASSAQSSIRELEGRLMQIMQTLKAKNLDASYENIASHLGKAPKKLLSLTHTQVISAICNYFNITSKELTGPRRQKGLVLPRHFTMYILSEELGMTVEKIGQLLGGRDHTTVMHARDKIRELVLKDREVQRMFIEVKQNLSTL